MGFAISCAFGTLFAAGAHAAILEAAVIRDSSVYGAGALFDLYKNHLGRAVTAETAPAIGAALQQKYLADGYSRPGYRILDRGTASGLVRIEVVEASISRVQVNGDAGPHRQRLRALLDGLPTGQTLRPAAVRDVLRRARSLPGLDVDVATEPDAASGGGVVLELDSTYRPFEGSVKLTNRGTEEIGRNLLFARLATNGLIGRRNTTGFYLATAQDGDNYRGGGFFTNTALGEGGTSVLLQGATTSLAFETQGIRVSQGRDRWSLMLEHELGADAQALTFRGGFRTEDLDVEYNGLTARGERLRSVELAASRLTRGDASQRLASIELEQGLSAFGARVDNIVNPTDATEHEFLIARLRYVYLRRLNDAWILRWDSLAQHSPDVVPSIKRFRVGGGRIGRGFEAAATRGDSGIGNKLELKRQIAAASWLERADVYGFYDLGTTWRNDSGGRESAASAGVGVALRGGWFSGQLELARPLTHADADGRKDVRLFAEITARF